MIEQVRTVIYFFSDQLGTTQNHVQSGGTYAEPRDSRKNMSSKCKKTPRVIQKSITTTEEIHQVPPYAAARRRFFFAAHAEMTLPRTAPPKIPVVRSPRADTVQVELQSMKHCASTGWILHVRLVNLFEAFCMFARVHFPSYLPTIPPIVKVKCNILMHTCAVQGYRSCQLKGEIFAEDFVRYEHTTVKLTLKVCMK